jgi:hypothetical protein
MEVDIIDLFSRLPCAVGEIVGAPSMTFHGNPIAHGHCTIAMIGIKKGTMKLPFPNLVASKIKDVANGVVLWQEKDVVVACK